MLTQVENSCDLGEVDEHDENLRRRRKDTPHQENMQEYKRHRRQDEGNKEPDECDGTAKAQHDPEPCAEAHDDCVLAPLEP